MKVLISLVLMVSWMEPAEFFPDFSFDVLDFFAGAARVARAARVLGMNAASFDIGFHENPRVFDINSSAGFVLLHCHTVTFYRIFVFYLGWMNPKLPHFCLTANDETKKIQPIAR